MRVVIFALLLSGCGASGAVSDKPQVISVPVAVGCVSGARPEAVASLKTQFPEWDEMSVKQKAGAVAAQGLRHMNRADGIDAATSACK